MDDGAGGIIRRDVQALARKVGFVHLHLHTSFSLREGALTIAKLIKFAKADDQPALAITDTNNLFGALEFSEKVSKEGIQPIIGCQLTVDFGDGKKLGARADDPAAGRGSIVLHRADRGGLFQPHAARFARMAGIRSRRHAAREPARASSWTRRASSR